MGIINELFSPPGLEHLHLMSYLIFFLLLFHLPYLGIVLGSSALSVAYRQFNPELSDDFIKLSVGSPWTWLAFGLIPAGTLAVLYKMLLFNSTLRIHVHLGMISGLMVAGFLALIIYRRTRFLLAGAAGVLMLGGYCFHFVNLMSLMIFPEKWPMLKSWIPYPLFSITPLVQFGAFIFMTMIMTGATILLFYFKWAEKKLTPDNPNFNLIRWHGYGLILVGALVLPLMIFWDLLTLPAYALSIPVFVISGFIVVVGVFLVAAATAMIKKYNQPLPPFAITAFILALLLFGLVIGKDRTLQANASLETIKVLEMNAQKVRADIVNKREEIYAKSMIIDPAEGEKIFNERCTACHDFEKKILGPPYNDVLPKYYGKTRDLEKFIMKPTKIDPAYPSMPAQGLSTIQTKSVVKYLMQKMGQDSEKDTDKVTEKPTENVKDEGVKND